MLVLVAFAAVATAGYTYMRRQWLQYLRQEAIEGASALVTNLQAFEASTASALALIQEVELVSRGYRLYVRTPTPSHYTLTRPTGAAHCRPSHAWKRGTNHAAASDFGATSMQPLRRLYPCSQSNAKFQSS